jgi:hypothetical protein
MSRQAARMVARIQFHTAHDDDAFLAYFSRRRHATSGMHCHDQLLLASFVNQIRDLFEAREDALGHAKPDL